MFKRPFTPGWALQKYSEQMGEYAEEHTLAIAVALAHSISNTVVSVRDVAVTTFCQSVIVKQITVALMVVDH
jgi:hypothetical protein